MLGTSVIAVGLLVQVIVLGPLHDDDNYSKWIILNANALMAVCRISQVLAPG